MIRARFFRRGGRYTGFSVEGHAGFAEAGNDIVCAGVSSAVQTAANTITEAAGLPAKVSVRNGAVTLTLPSALAPKDAVLCETVIRGLRLQLTAIAGQFPGRVRVRDGVSSNQW